MYIIKHTEEIMRFDFTFLNLEKQMLFSKAGGWMLLGNRLNGVATCSSFLGALITCSPICFSTSSQHARKSAESPADHQSFSTQTFREVLMATRECCWAQEGIKGPLDYFLFFYFLFYSICSPHKDVCRKRRKTVFVKRLNHVEKMVGLLCLARKQLVLGDDARRKQKKIK